MRANRPRIEINERAVRWVATLNNPDDNWEEMFRNEEFIEKIAYCVVGQEHAPTTNTRHLHIYLRFKEKQYRSSIRRFMAGTWFEPARGSETQAVQYATKESKILEIGHPFETTTKALEKEQRFKDMLKDVVEMDWPEFELKYQREAFYHRKQLMEYKINHLPPQSIWDGDLAEKNFWVAGTAGTGKSLWARTRAPAEQIYPKNCNKWWDGYNPSQHKIVVIEDFPKDGVMFAQLMKIWSDRYSFVGEVKGGQIAINPARFFLIITSNFTIDEVFPGDDNIAIRRRFKEWIITERNDIRLQHQLDFQIIQN